MKKTLRILEKEHNLRGYQRSFAFWIQNRTADEVTNDVQSPDLYFRVSVGLFIY